MTNWPPSFFLFLLISFFILPACQKSSSELPPSAVNSPQITGVLPNTVRAGEIIRVVGTGFGDSQGLSTLTLNEIPVLVDAINWTDNEVRVLIDSEAQTGAFNITVNNIKSNNALLSILWSTSNPINTPISITSGAQTNHKIISDNNGGAILVWSDTRNILSEIYAQRFDAQGKRLWENGIGSGDFNGISISTTSINKTAPQIISDENGGAIIMWTDTRNGNEDIYAQRINSLGQKMWATDVSVSTAIDAQYNPQVIPDQHGGAIVAWFDNRNISTNIYSQRINALGQRLWENEFASGDFQGIPVSAFVFAGSFSTLRLVSDESNGAIIVWSDSRMNQAISAQRMASYGQPLWNDGSGNILITSSFNNTFTNSSDNIFQLIKDGAGGIIVAWNDYRFTGNNVNKLMVQRLNSDGQRLWENGLGSGDFNGKVAASLSDDHQNLKIDGDGNGGAFLTWATGFLPAQAMPGSSGIYTQHINGQGVPLWSETTETLDNYGLSVTTGSTGSKLSPKINSDNNSGAIISWANSIGDIYAQRFNTAGEPLWENGKDTGDYNGLPVSSAVGNQSNPEVLVNKYGGAFFIWNDARNSPEVDIYAQSISASGSQ